MTYGPYVTSSNNEILEPLSTDQIEVIAYIEKHWFKFNGHFPSYEVFIERFPNFDINDSLNHKTFRLALVNRGIDPPVGPLDYDDLNMPQGITKEQLAAIVTVVNFEDRRSRATKLKELGITPQQWQGWLKQTAFKEFLHELSASNLSDAAYVANDALVRAMDRGDVNAIKYYGEITGRAQRESPQLQNIKIVLARVVESIQKHIKDPELLQAIGEDFERILSGAVTSDRELEESK